MSSEAPGHTYTICADHDREFQASAKGCRVRPHSYRHTGASRGFFSRRANQKTPKAVSGKPRLGSRMSRHGAGTKVDQIQDSSAYSYKSRQKTGPVSRETGPALSKAGI